MKYTKEELVEICDELIKWALKDDSLSLMQFFLTEYATKRKLTKQKLDYLINTYSALNDTFFYAKCILVDKILNSKTLQENTFKASLIRYLRMYDEYLKESEQTENLERNIALGVATLFSEDYSKEQLEGDFAKIHANNLMKRQKTMDPSIKKSDEHRNK
jgi:uncharacterized protein YpiB (UPF0302 family)